MLGLALALKLLASFEIPAGTPFGGISGIDYDRRADEWLMISDDRSDDPDVVQTPRRGW